MQCSEQGDIHKLREHKRGEGGLPKVHMNTKASCSKMGERVKIGQHGLWMTTKGGYNSLANNLTHKEV